MRKMAILLIAFTFLIAFSEVTQAAKQEGEIFFFNVANRSLQLTVTQLIFIAVSSLYQHCSVSRRSGHSRLQSHVTTGSIFKTFLFLFFFSRSRKCAPENLRKSFLLTIKELKSKRMIKETNDVFLWLASGKHSNIDREPLKGKLNSLPTAHFSNFPLFLPTPKMFTVAMVYSASAKQVNKFAVAMVVFACVVCACNSDGRLFT